MGFLILNMPLNLRYIILEIIGEKFKGRRSVKWVDSLKTIGRISNVLKNLRVVIWILGGL